jgi:hypothetical protein
VLDGTKLYDQTLDGGAGCEELPLLLRELDRQVVKSGLQLDERCFQLSRRVHRRLPFCRADDMRIPAPHLAA